MNISCFDLNSVIALTLQTHKGAVYAPTLSRPENIVYFFRTIKQVDCISKETLRQRTDQYLSWVNAYTHNREILLVWSQKDVRKKDDFSRFLAQEPSGLLGPAALKRGIDNDTENNG